MPCIRSCDVVSGAYAAHLTTTGRECVTGYYTMSFQLSTKEVGYWGTFIWPLRFGSLEISRDFNQLQFATSGYFVQCKLILIPLHVSDTVYAKQL